MAVSDAQKKANQKWDSANMATLACKLRKEQAEAFKLYCRECEKTVNSALRDYVLSCLNHVELDMPERQPFITIETLEIASSAAEKAGETAPEFIARAVETQAQRDEVSRVLLEKGTKR